MQIAVDASRAVMAQRTGTERYSLEIISHLVHLPQADHEWLLYTRTPPDATAATRLGIGALPNVHLQLLPGHRLWTHRALARAILRDQPAVLFVPAHVIPLVLPVRRLPPSVVTIHDLGYRHQPDAHTFSQRTYLDLSTRWSLHAATAAICVSMATAADVMAYYGTEPAKLHVVHEAYMPGPEPAATTSDCRAQYGLSRPYALFVGTIQPRKNLARVIAAFASISEQVPWDLILVGRPGWHSEPIYRQAAAAHLPDRIRFLDYVPDAAMVQLLRQARFFCFPSLFEGFGLPVLEAQAQGIPVMTSTNSSLPEVAGDAALLVDPNDTEAIAAAMLRISTDEELRARLITAGYANVRRFSWERAARETLDVLTLAAQTSADS